MTRVTVGRIGRPHGLAGQVTVRPSTDNPDERFAAGVDLLCVPAGGGPERKVRVQDHRWVSGRLVLRLDGVVDRTGAEGLVGSLLEVDVDVAEVIDDEYHDLALVGLDVRDRAAHGPVLGRITEVAHMPGQDVLVVARPDRLDLLVPFVQVMVPVVDLAAGHVVVDLPDGLDDLAEEPDRGP